MEENKQYEEVKEKSAFVADGTWTQEMLLDLQKVWTGRRISYLCIFILFALIFVWNLVTMYLDFLVTVVAFAVVVVYALVLFWTPHATAKRQFETHLVSCGGEVKTSLCFTEDAIEQFNHNTGAHVHIDYTRIQTIQKTKLCYLLWMEKRVVLLFSRDHLKKGTEAELEAFLIQKCPLAKRKF